MTPDNPPRAVRTRVGSRYYADIDNPNPPRFVTHDTTPPSTIQIRVHMQQIYVEDRGDYLVIHGATATGKTMSGQRMRIPKNKTSVNALITLLQRAMAAPSRRKKTK